MTEVLTQDQIAFYEENGYLILERHLPDTWLETISGEIARPKAANPNAAPATFSAVRRDEDCPKMGSFGCSVLEESSVVFVIRSSHDFARRGS